jgi:hypothetical protein
MCHLVSTNRICSSYSTYILLTNKRICLTSSLSENKRGVGGEGQLTGKSLYILFPFVQKFSNRSVSSCIDFFLCINFLWQTATYIKGRPRLLRVWTLASGVDNTFSCQSRDPSFTPDQVSLRSWVILYSGGAPSPLYSKSEPLFVTFLYSCHPEM